MITQHHVHLRDAHKTPQFWLIWAVLCLNVAAGIGVIGMASPMLQEIFGGSLIGHARCGFTAARRRSRRTRSRRSPPASPACCRCSTSAAGSSGPRSRTRSAARRPTTPSSLLGIALYALGALGRAHRQQGAVRAVFCVILSMYGGGFATVPAYLADMFGTQFVGAIHGRLLTAWSTAGIIGPVVVNYIRESRSPPACRATQSTTSRCTSWPGCWCSGFICNLPDPAARPTLVHEPRGGRGAPGQGQRGQRPRPRGSFGIGTGGFDARPRSGLARRRHPDRLGRLDHAVQGVGVVRLVRSEDLWRRLLAAGASSLSRRRCPPPSA